VGICRKSAESSRRLKICRRVENPVILVVAEKRSVAQAIAKYLGGTYRARRVHGVPAYYFKHEGRDAVSLGLSGHIADYDFPARHNIWALTPPEELFRVAPVLVIREDAINYVRALKALARRAEKVYLALDADVEGEAIAYEAMLAIRSVNRRASIYRVRFNAVTHRDIHAAFRQPTGIDLKQVEKVFARMRIDLVLGAAFTRLFTLTVRDLLSPGRFLSYGPCQTPVLGIVTSRELERMNFRPEKYYIVRAAVEVGGHRLEVSSTARFKSREQAEAAAAAVRRGVVRVASYRQQHVQPPEPLDTVELERRASRWLGINSKRALDTAEGLYRAGYISYPRTETTIYPPTLDLAGVLRELSPGEHGDYARELLQRGFRPTRGGSNDGAHPPIYPVRGATRDEIYRALGRLGRHAWAIYDFVVRHFLATLSPPALVERQRVVVDFGAVQLEAEGQRVINPGYWRIYPWERQRDAPLPRVSVGDAAVAVRVEVLERETEPPPRLSESELLAIMRRHGIGTDATMQEHIHTNIKRGYIKLEGKRCVPTALGMALATTLFKHAPELIEPTVRARIERALQDVVRGSVSPPRLIEEVKAEFERYFNALKSKGGEVRRALAEALRGSAAGGAARI
jgi:DNA topoisomerase-1